MYALCLKALDEHALILANNSLSMRWIKNQQTKQGCGERTNWVLVTVLTCHAWMDLAPIKSCPQISCPHNRVARSTSTAARWVLLIPQRSAKTSRMRRGREGLSED